MPRRITSLKAPPPPGQEPLADGPCELRPLGHRADEVRHQPPRQRAAIELDCLAHQCQQIRAGRARVRHLDLLVDECANRRRHQLVLRRIAAIDRALADPGPSGDVLRAELVHAALGDQLERRFQDRAVRPRVPWPPDRTRGSICAA